MPETIMITGATSGIGLATAEAFAKRASADKPIELLILGRRMDRLEAFAERWRGIAGVGVVCVKLDVRDNAAVKKFGEKFQDSLARLDILVNNAGLAAGRDPIQSGNIDDWEQMIDTNLKGLLYVTRLVTPHLIKRGAGHIVNIGSVAGRAAYRQGAVYCATKFGVRAINDGLRMDLLGSGVRVTSIDPGMVDTEFSLVRFKGNEEIAKAIYKDFTPLTAEDIANSILWVTSVPKHVNVQEMLIMPTDQAMGLDPHRRLVPKAE